MCADPLNELPKPSELDVFRYNVSHSASYGQALLAFQFHSKEHCSYASPLKDFDKKYQQHLLETFQNQLPECKHLLQELFVASYVTGADPALPQHAERNGKAIPIAQEISEKVYGAFKNAANRPPIQFYFDEVGELVVLEKSLCHMVRHNLGWVSDLAREEGRLDSANKAAAQQLNL